MCGITGLLDADGLAAAPARELAGRMAAAIATRGPDDAGTWSDGAHVAFGFRRLAILDLSPLGQQPMASASGRYTIAFNGEIYNHRELGVALAAQGHRFRGRSDTEVLLACIEQYGFVATLPKLRGMFALAVWDATERALYLARDRMGEKPLYYGWVRGGSLLLFGSELKALQAHPQFAADIDRGALMKFMRHGYVPAPRSIYQGIHKLPQGMWVRISPTQRGAEPQSYYSFRDVAEAGLAAPLVVSLDDAADQFGAELARAVGEQMVADVPLGAFLSGGIDSSLVVMMMQQQSTRPVKTFSIGFDSARYDETAYAREVATRLGTDHTEFHVTGADALALIPQLPTIYDEPFADSSQIPTTLVSRLARQHVTVALTGDGGDEILAGYPRYATLRKLARFYDLPGRRALATVADRLVAAVSRDGDAATLDRRALDWLRRRTDIASAADLDAFYELLMSLWYHPEWVVPDVAEPRGIMPLTKDVLARGNVTERAMYVDTVQNLADALLVKVDRAAMSNSLETRLPLLDHRVVELAWRLPYATKVAGDRGKLVMRQLLARQLPPRLFERPKMGFMIPVVPWLRGPLRDWAESLLFERALREDGFLQPEIIRRRWQGFLAGTRDWHGPLWPVLMWQAWRQHQTRLSAPSTP
ncbi:MAG: asparagine synthase (glutamine-hydrolyzing) [Myxococcales bacterium]|nr:asparagine synthase (glutamine-hydrolyzing) [Myxococcales bacterium]